FAEVAISRAQCEAFLRSDRWTADYLNVHTKIFNHRLNHLELLIILFSKISPMRLYHVKEFCNNGCHAFEMSWPKFTFENFQIMSTRNNCGFSYHPIHFFNGRQKYRVDLSLFEKCKISLFCAR